RLSGVVVVAGAILPERDKVIHADRDSFIRPQPELKVGSGDGQLGELTRGNGDRRGSGGAAEVIRGASDDFVLAFGVDGEREREWRFGDGANHLSVCQEYHA